jgi:GDP-L-fucose synthase
LTLKISERIYVAGHRGLVGSAIVRRLRRQGYATIVTRTRSELDLCDQAAVRAFFQSEKIDQVYLAAAKVGGIFANNAYPAEFIYENLMVQVNVINEAYRAGVTKLLFLGSSCVYPRLARQPMQEEALLTGRLEPTNEPYAVAKIAGIKLCESYNRQYGVDYRSVMPTNVYGIGDTYHSENSHVIPALIKRFHEAKQNNAAQTKVWGSGAAMREFLYVDDLADASVYVMDLEQAVYSANTRQMLSHINVGSGEDISICDLASNISSVVNYNGEIVFDTSKPDGAPRKLMDVSRLYRLGWRPGVTLMDGLKMTYEDFLTGAARETRREQSPAGQTP